MGGFDTTDLDVIDHLTGPMGRTQEVKLMASAQCKHGVEYHLLCPGCEAEHIIRQEREGLRSKTPKDAAKAVEINVTGYVYGKDRIGSSAERKTYPLCTGLLDYFPDALLEVAHVSFVGNEQHNPGEKLHWAREKSIGEGNEILRHMIDRGKLDSDGTRHMAKAAWRCLELLQREIEADHATKERK